MIHVNKANVELEGNIGRLQLELAMLLYTLRDSGMTKEQIDNSIAGAWEAWDEVNKTVEESNE